jgi:broad specificity phosphatase PhoE
MESSAKHIFLIRHQRPALSKKGWFGRKQARQFIRDYDTVDIEALVNKPAGLPFEQISRVYCSRLPRARLTARAIFGSDIELIEDPDFNEFQRRIFELPLLKLPLKFWLLSARALWLLGLNNQGIETFKQARVRARRCAERLTREAEKDNKVVLVAHGFLNAFIKRALKQMGWRVVRHDGQGFLGVTELIKTMAP